MDQITVLNSKSVGFGEVILMIHGIMSDHESFDRAQAILGKNYKTVTYDRRGYGLESDLPCQDYSVETQAEDAVAVLKQYTNEPAYIIGDSTGGNIAVQMAAVFPHLVKGLFLVETTIPCAGLDLSCLDAWRNGARRIAESGDIYKIVPLFAKITGSKPAAQKSSGLKNIKKSIYNIRNFIYGEMKDITVSSFSADDISKIRCPVIMGISSEGKELPFGLGAQKTADFFGWETVYLRGHHNTIQEYPLEFCDKVKEFIKYAGSGFYGR